jgi:hypothetical protein
MKCKIHLVGSLEDFKPKFDKLKDEDFNWIMGLDKPKGQNHFKMDLDEVIRFLTMFNEIERIFFEVR